MRIGDLVECFTNCPDRRIVHGVIVAFNEKGEGGQDYVHVMCEGKIHIFMKFDVEVINKKN